jgi:hypothetical protein
MCLGVPQPGGVEEVFMRILSCVVIVCAALAGLLSTGCTTPKPAPEEGMEAVDSSLIKSVKYDDITEDLSLVFQNGDVYVYGDVPPPIAQGLMGARSKGKYYHRHIKPKYKAEKK